MESRVSEKESSETRGAPVGTSKARRTAALFEDLNAVESRLDPAPARRGQVIADLVTVALLAVAVLAVGVPIERPILLASLLVLGALTTRGIRRLLGRRLRRERDRLLDDLDAPDEGPR